MILIHYTEANELAQAVRQRMERTGQFPSMRELVEWKMGRGSYSRRELSTSRKVQEWTKAAVAALAERGLVS